MGLPRDRKEQTMEQGTIEAIFEMIAILLFFVLMAKTLIAPALVIIFKKIKRLTIHASRAIKEGILIVYLTLIKSVVHTILTEIRSELNSGLSYNDFLKLSHNQALSKIGLGKWHEFKDKKETQVLITYDFVFAKDFSGDYVMF